MDAQVVVDFFGGVNKTARAFGVQPPSVSEWLRNGQLPTVREFQAQILSNGKFKSASEALPASNEAAA